MSGGTERYTVVRCAWERLRAGRDERATAAATTTGARGEADGKAVDSGAEAREGTEGLPR